MEIKCSGLHGETARHRQQYEGYPSALVVEIREEYKVQNEILHLAVNYINRFLSSMSLLRGKPACGHYCYAVSLKV